MGRGLVISAAGAALILVGSVELRAADLAPSGLRASATLTLVCDNGRSYPIRPRAVSSHDEMVTGYIITGPRRSHHFRLVPMGSGYRYAGAGFWFDGLRGEATLDIGSHQAACTVEYS